MNNSEIFEFMPSVYVNTPMAISELSKTYNISASALIKRCQKNHVYSNKGILSIDDCNLILNEKSDMRNWKIVNYFNLSDAASYIRKSRSCTKNKLDKFEIPYIKQELWLDSKPLGYIWVSKTNLEKLKLCVEQDEENLNSDKYVTCNSIAKKYNVNIHLVQRIAIKSKLPYISDKNVHLYTKEDGARIEVLVQAFLDDKTIVMKNIEELKVEHPLVKDNKLFNENYFPESLPLQFQDIEDD